MAGSWPTDYYVVVSAVEDYPAVASDFVIKASAGSEARCAPAQSSAVVVDDTAAGIAYTPGSEALAAPNYLACQGWAVETR
jgi:hypothetical protein